MTTYNITIHVPEPAPDAASGDAALNAALESIKQQLGSIMSIVSDFQARATAANSAMAAATLAMQRLRQAYDAQQEQIALLQQTPSVPAGGAVLTAAELATIDQAHASLADSTLGLMDAVESNALLAATPPAP